MASTNATNAADPNKPSVARDVAQYRKDTKTFENWLFLVSDEIIRTNPTEMKPSDPHIGDHTTRDWAPRSRLVIQFRQSVPSYILPTIKSAFETRQKVYNLYKATDGNIAHEDRQHRFFIRSLTESFNILGGPEWVRKREARRQAAIAAATPQDDGWTDASMATKKSRHRIGVHLRILLIMTDSLTADWHVNNVDALDRRPPLRHKNYGVDGTLLCYAPNN
ncbi:hypothetical protein B0T24DRAFT_671302 [Lasiosphaeria ovina]|uniref:DUF6604 domain-containing protein n=1 Tax=Lasiosphaeria ovina TaxID=92902 RepID=A0AAE0JTL5_9PEZI|nr:hypothetical protein B0T24DRAFT_671302 [Lasiosphaeria ovina]